VTRGERVCAFIERYCRVPEGDLIGQPMVLEPFQRKFILDVYDNPFGTRRGYLTIAKKNGKTGLIGGILLAHVAGPEARRNTQIASGAMSREQAATVFELAMKMVQLSPALSRVIRAIPSKKMLRGLVRNVVYQAKSAEAKTTHGGSPILVILDEIGQVIGPRDSFVSALTTSQGAYRDALLLAISTQAATDNDLFSIWLDTQRDAPDPRVISHVYSAPEDCDLDDRAAWAMANPALGRFKAISDLEFESATALAIPSYEAEFRNYQLNQRVEKTSPFVSRTVWKQNEAKPRQPLDGRRVYGGLDLSAVTDLTALVLEAEDGDVYPTFWLPAVGLEEKTKKDHVPWDIWVNQGHLLTTPGRAIEYEYVAEYLRGVFDRCEVVRIGFDRYNWKFLKPWLEKANFSEEELSRFVEFGQGTASMTPALRALEVKLVQGKIRHGDHPVLNMCAANAKTVGESGARKFDRIRSRGRIDGMVALAMAEGVMPQDKQDEGDFGEFLRNPIRSR